MIDNKTPRLALPLPDIDNYLEDDVVRLSDALSILDANVATVGADGKVPAQQMPDLSMSWEGELVLDGGSPSGAVSTYSTGSLPTASSNALRTIFVTGILSHPIPCYSDGTSWRKFSDNSVIS